MIGACSLKRLAGIYTLQRGTSEAASASGADARWTRAADRVGVVEAAYYILCSNFLCRETANSTSFPRSRDAQSHAGVCLSVPPAWARASRRTKYSKYDRVCPLSTVSSLLPSNKHPVTDVPASRTDRAAWARSAHARTGHATHPPLVDRPLAGCVCAVWRLSLSLWTLHRPRTVTNSLSTSTCPRA